MFLARGMREQVTAGYLPAVEAQKQQLALDKITAGVGIWVTTFMAASPRFPLRDAAPRDFIDFGLPHIKSSVSAVAFNSALSTKLSLTAKLNMALGLLQESHDRETGELRK